MHGSRKQLLSIIAEDQSTLVKILYHMQGYNGVKLAATHVDLAM